MTDRGHQNAASNRAANGAQKPISSPATKSQLYGGTWAVYRPQPHHRRRRDRSCCCSVCFWVILVIIVLVLIVGIGSAIIYAGWYSSVIARNSNKKLTFAYNNNSILIAILTGGIDASDGLFPGFIRGKKNMTVQKAFIAGTGLQLDGDSVSALNSKMKSKNGLQLKIKMDTEVKIKLGILKTRKVGIRARCDGIAATTPAARLML